MKICVLGLWHLGCVTAACCAKYFDVTGLDFDSDLLAGLEQGRAPISEPGLNELLQEGIEAGRLRFTSDIAAACQNADVLWVCYDTPVDQNDVADVESVLREVRRVTPHLPSGATIILSSQLPAGTCRQLEREFNAVSFACAPENLRLGNALNVFLHAERIVIGVRDEAARQKLEPLFARFCDNLIWMSPESAELTKHAINAFLALSVTYMNEVAAVCEQMGADAKEVEAGLKSDARIGKRAYLSPGEAFAGGTLARDVVTMSRLGQENDLSLALIPSIQTSNNHHKSWALNKLRRELSDVSGSIIAVLGLTYKPGTDTLRRSSALELCRELLKLGARVQAFDPVIHSWPDEMKNDFQDVLLCESVQQAVRGANAVVLCTQWPEFKDVDWSEVAPLMSGNTLLDANRFVASGVLNLPDIKYLTVGLGR